MSNSDNSSDSQSDYDSDYDSDYESVEVIPCMSNQCALLHARYTGDMRSFREYSDEEIECMNRCYAYVMSKEVDSNKAFVITNMLRVALLCEQYHDTTTPSFWSDMYAELSEDDFDSMHYLMLYAVENEYTRRMFLFP